MDDILPGPSRRTIIVDNSYHVSDDVWSGSDRGPLECFGGGRLIRTWILSDAQKELLHLVGFGLFADIDIGVQNDTSLLSALVERWRPETNTFFMRRGEMTVTLQDVGFILGLPILGRPMTGEAVTNPKGYFRRNWFEPLTDADMEVAWGKKGGIKFTWLKERYGSAAVVDPERIGMHTQAYLMLVLGSVLFPTRSRNVVHPRYIGLLRDISRIHSYSWGSGVLAYLYRGLGQAVKKTSRHICGCMMLLQIWSYERLDMGLPIPVPEQDPYPVANYWSYSKTKPVKAQDDSEKGNQKGVEKQVLGKRRRVSKGPHHNLPHYRGELDGVRSDLVTWMPYARFEEVNDDVDDGDPDRELDVDWIDIQAHLGGQARVPLICFDIVEYQHPDRVLRQFGLSPCIPRPPIDMTVYRKPKLSFIAWNWMSRWFAEIGEWTRFCNMPDIALADAQFPVSEEVYMDWYADISRLRVGKPKPEPESIYSSMELYNNLHAYELIEAAMDFARQVDARMPDSFIEDFREIAPNLVQKYCSFMKILKGPAFKAPVFEHLDSFERVEAQGGLIAEADIIDMTQPSQHVPDKEVGEASTSKKPAKLELQRLKEGRWKINKVLSIQKKDKLKNEWGWEDGEVKLEGISHDLYFLKPTEMLSLGPGRWIDDRIIYAYMALLREREEAMAMDKLWPRKPSYYFLDPLFMQVAISKLKYTPISNSKAWDSFYCDYGSAIVGPNINKVDFIFVPACVNENHWILFVYAVKLWGVVLIDPLHDDPHYELEETIMVRVLPKLLRFCGMNIFSYPEGDAGLQALTKRPKQSNGSDCGIFIMKYMDYLLQGFDLATLPWNSRDIETFRYRIARELQKGKARPIPGFLMRQRLENASKA